MKIGRNSEILLVVMFFSIIVAYLIAFYLPGQGINVLTFGQVVPGSGTCQCPTDYQPNNGVCQISCSFSGNPPCPPDTTPCLGTSCGASGQSCCANSQCNSGLTCQSGTCQTSTQCGASGQSCCASNNCNSGLACQSGTCQTTTCTCPSGYQSYNDVCRANCSFSGNPPCPPDEVPCQTPAGCVQNNPSITVNPTSVNANLGDVENFTVNVTNTDNSLCGNTTFAVNSSTPTFTLLNITASLFNFTATPNVFVLPPGQSQTVNVSAQTFFAFVGNYTVNISAADTSNSTHMGIANVSLNISESVLPLNFTCSPIQNGIYRCDFDFVSNSINPITIYFFVSNSKGKVVSNGGLTALITSAMNFGFHCSTFEPGTYTVSWFAYKASDVSLTNPISWSSTSEDQTLKC